MTSNTTQEEKANAFRALHEGEPFVIPNPWDSGSAKVLAGLDIFMSVPICFDT